MIIRALLLESNKNKELLIKELIMLETKFAEREKKVNKLKFLQSIFMHVSHFCGNQQSIKTGKLLYNL